MHLNLKRHGVWLEPGRRVAMAPLPRQARPDRGAQGRDGLQHIRSRRTLASRARELPRPQGPAAMSKASPASEPLS